MAMKSQGQILYYHYNPHGDVVAMTDQSGDVVAKYEYDAWGNVISPSVTGIAADNPFGYAGYMYDKETSTYYLMARYYHPKHGVFITMDPDPRDDDPITQNGYIYSNNSPVMNVDPDGQFAFVIGVYFIPSLGQAALFATGVVIFGGITYKAGSWLGKKAKEYYIKAQNNKQTKTRIEGLQKQVQKHKEKIAKSPNSAARKHWEKEIKAWEQEIARLRKRLK